MMSYSIVLDSFVSLEKGWQEFLHACANNHIFITPQWQRAWWQTFGNGNELLLLSVRQGSELVAIAPMMYRNGKLALIGSSDVCDYMDFIARRGEEASVFLWLLDYLESLEWGHIDLESLLPNSLALTYFVPLAQQKGYRVQTTQVDVSPQLTLPTSWKDYLSQLKSKGRHELQRKLRRLEKTKAIRHYTIADKEQLYHELESFFELFKMSSPEKARFMTDEKQQFFKAMVSSLAEAGYVRLSFLEVGGVRATASLCFDYDNSLYLYNSGYDPTYASLSVSLLLKAFCIRESIEGRKKRFDFLRGDEPYKYDLGGQDVPIYRCLISRS